jgi:GntR family transcriptional regulator
MSGEPQLRIVLDSPVPIYRQIVDQIRAHCVQGTLVPGAQLPSVRELAASLGAHHNTVAEAYRTLAHEGWLAVRHGRRVIVLDRAQPLRPLAAAAGDNGLRLHGLIAELLAQGFDAPWIRQQIEAALNGRAL